MSLFSISGSCRPKSSFLSMIFLYNSFFCFIVSVNKQYTVYTGLNMTGCEYSLLLILPLALNPTLNILHISPQSAHILSHYESSTNDPSSSSFWITKGGRMWPQFIGLFSQDPLCFLFTARLGVSQDSQGTHVATYCCAACKQGPGLTCVYRTTLLGYCCVPNNAAA